MNQDEIIERFIAKYAASQDKDHRITRWPDKENRKSRDCDAFAEGEENVPLAIEHTRIQTFDGQMLDGARFIKIMGQLETDLRDAFDFQVTLLVPTFAIQPGSDWQATRGALREWLLANIPVLAALAIVIVSQRQVLGGALFTKGLWREVNEPFVVHINGF